MHKVTIGKLATEHSVVGRDVWLEACFLHLMQQRITFDCRVSVPMYCFSSVVRDNIHMTRAFRHQCTLILPRLERVSCAHLEPKCNGKESTLSLTLYTVTSGMHCGYLHKSGDASQIPLRPSSTPPLFEKLVTATLRVVATNCSSFAKYMGL